MDQELAYWKNKCHTLQSQNLALKSELQMLATALQKSLHKAHTDAEEIERLKQENSSLKFRLKEETVMRQTLEDQMTSTSPSEEDHTEDLLRSVYSPNYLYSSKKQISSLQTHRKSIEPLVKTPPAQPDTPDAIEELDSPIRSFGPRLFEEFFIVGIPDGLLKSANLVSAAVLYQFPAVSLGASSHVYSALPSFCFPSGISARSLVHSASGSDMNSLIYGQGALARQASHYVFTLRGETSSDYEEAETLYCCCIQIEDIHIENDAEWITPKVYCILSKFPFFSLHFEILHKILAMKRLRRMGDIVSLGHKSEISGEKIARIMSKGKELGIDEIGMLDSCRRIRSMAPGTIIELEVSTLDPLNFIFPEDIGIELEWTCPIMFSALRFVDFFWLLMAALQENSIIFVSKNLGLLTSCVLGLTSLMKPFKWIHLMMPVVPQCLKEVIEAPLPFIVGLHGAPPLNRISYSHIIWVLLDDPRKEKRISARKEVMKEVREPYAENMKPYLNGLYKHFDESKLCYNPNEMQRRTCVEIAHELEKYFSSILESITEECLEGDNYLDIEFLSAKLLHKHCVSDHSFLRNFLKSQIFIKAVEEKYCAQKSVRI